MLALAFGGVFMKRRILGNYARAARGVAVLLAVLLWEEAARAEVPSIYLVQNSGWMEPFYTDPNSQFRPLLQALMTASGTGGEVLVADFNQDGQLPGRRSPNLIYKGAAGSDPIARAVAALDLPRRPNGKLADADFNGALGNAITELLAGRSGIVWIVTNNKNSPSNSQEVKDNTRAFAQALSRSEHLPYIVAYPVRQPVQGKAYAERGLIIYGIAYGAEAAATLRQVVRGPAMTALFPDPPVQLKPLDQAPLVFTPTAVLTQGIDASMEGGVLVFRGLPTGEPVTIEVRGELRSEYYPHVIEKATVSLGWAGLEGESAAGMAAGIEPASVTRVKPYDVLENVVLRLQVPAIERPSGLDGLLASGDARSGAIEIGLGGVELTLLDGFVSKMSEITALDQLPEVFFDYRAVKVASTQIPVRVEVAFSAAPLMALLGGLAAALLAALAAAFLLFRDREYAVPIQGRTQRIRLRPFESREFKQADGGVLRVRGAVLGRPSITAIPAHKA